MLYTDALGIQKYKLGDPTDPSTTLGPVVSVASADRIKKQVADAGAYTDYSCFHFLPSIRRLPEGKDDSDSDPPCFFVIPLLSSLLFFLPLFPSLPFI